MSHKAIIKLRLMRGGLKARKTILEGDIASTRNIIEELQSEWYKGYMSAQLISLSSWVDETERLIYLVSQTIEELENGPE